MNKYTLSGYLKVLNNTKTFAAWQPDKKENRIINYKEPLETCIKPKKTASIRYAAN